MLTIKKSSYTPVLRKRFFVASFEQCSDEPKHWILGEHLEAYCVGNRAREKASGCVFSS